jgi:ribonuclease HI
MRQEHDKSIWKRIKRVTKTSTSRACLEVQVQEHESTTTYTNKTDIEDVIQREIKSRFALGYSAPISRTLLGNDLQYLTNSEVAFSIINGSFQIPEDLDDATKLILQEIGILGRRVLEGDMAPRLTITGADYIQYHKRIKESTSSSPSGLHHGHCKAAAFSMDIAEIHATQMNLIIRSGVHPLRWGTALQVLLEKVAGVCLVEKLRSIQLYEADLNWFMKFIFNDGALTALKSANFLPEEHYSQKESTAEDACFDKTLTYDISRQTRTLMAVMSVDAAQCYDRVHHGLMSLIWLALTRNLSVVQTLLTCLGDIKIYTRTGSGDSTTFFGGRSNRPACGLGQGSKAAPASWVQLSSIFVKIFKERGFGASMLDPITQSIIHSIGCLFVDDTDLYAMEALCRSVVDVLASAQQAISLWSSLLAATGGAIKTEKSFWCMIDYAVTNSGKWTYAPFQPYPLTIVQNGENIKIPQRSVMDSDKTLGVYHCPAGGHSEHLKQLRTRTLEWLAQMKNGRLPPALVWKSYRIQLWARIKYALGTLTNSLEDANSCLNDIDFNLLPLLNVNRHIRTGWRRLHQSFGGIGLLHLPTEQLICRLNILQQHYGTQSIIGQKLICSLRWLQLQLGHDDNPLLLDYDRWHKLTCRSWWVELWQTLHNSPILLSLKYTKQLPPREDDSTIMQFLLDSELSTEVIYIMNRCRNFLNALFLSDIATADGRSIAQSVLDPSGPTPLVSTLSYPREKPTKSDWSVWRATWRQLTNTAFKLRRPLGPWRRPPSVKWKWFLQEESNCVLQISGEYTHVYSCILTSHTRSGNKYAYSHSHRSNVSDATPITPSVTCCPTAGTHVTVASRSPNTIPTALSTSEQFWDTLLTDGGAWMWEHFHFQHNAVTSVDWICQGLLQGTTLWVTDGSHFPQRGPYLSGAAWVVADTTSDKLMACSFTEQSPSASSYRAEALGLYSIHAFIRSLIAHYNLPTVSVEICCDNDAALKEASGRKRRIRTSASCADVFRGIRSITKQLKQHRWKYTWVKAHMDDLLEWTELSRAQQLNVMCDSLAKSVTENAIQATRGQLISTQDQLLPHENIAIHIDRIKQTSNPADQIRYSCGRYAAKLFLTSEAGWTETQFDYVDWENLHASLQSKPDGFRTWLAKQHSNFCATRVQMNRWFGSEDRKCPSCLIVDERADHLCKCTNVDRRKLLEADTTELIRWMSLGENTHPDITSWVEQFILSQDSPLRRVPHCSPEIQDLAHEQTVIGWRNFMEGRISKQFYRLQYCHLINAQTNMTAASWTRTFISKLLHITHSQWIFRNFMLHEQTHGLLRMREKNAILLQIEALSLSNKIDLPEHSRFLLEFDIGRLQQADYETQCYWVRAVEAAQIAVLGHSNTPNPHSNRYAVDIRQSRPRMNLQRNPHRQRERITDQPVVHRPSPSFMYACEDSNRTMKPD